MPEALTDEQILEIQDDAPASSPEVSEAQPTLPSDSTELSAPTVSDTTVETSSTAPKPSTPSKEVAPEKTAQQASLEDYQQLGEIPQIKDAIRDADALRSIDKALSTGDHAGMAEAVLNAYQEGPSSFPTLADMTLGLLQREAPQQYEQLITSRAGELLRQLGVWDWLEQTFAAANSRPEQVPAMLDRGANFFQQRFGLGPQVQSATSSTLPAEFRTAAAEGIHDFLDTNIRSALPGEFSTLSKSDQLELLTAIHCEVQDAIRGDRNLVLAGEKILQGGLTHQSGVEIFNLLTSKVQTLIPGAVRRILQQHSLSEIRASSTPAQKATTPAQPKVAAKPAQAASEISSLAEARAKGLSLGEILKLAEKEQWAVDADNPLTQDEANTMSDMDVLTSNRIGQRRGTSRPEDIFDKLAAAPR
jgi:hypothetical protein